MGLRDLPTPSIKRWLKRRREVGDVLRQAPCLCSPPARKGAMLEGWLPAQSLKTSRGARRPDAGADIRGIGQKPWSVKARLRRGPRMIRHQGKRFLRSWARKLGGTTTYRSALDDREYNRTWHDLTTFIVREA